MERRDLSKSPRHQRLGTTGHRADAGVADPERAPQAGKLPINIVIGSQPAPRGPARRLCDGRCECGPDAENSAPRRSPHVTGPAPTAYPFVGHSRRRYVGQLAESMFRLHGSDETTALEGGGEDGVRSRGHGGHSGGAPGFDVPRGKQWMPARAERFHPIRSTKHYDVDQQNSIRQRTGSVSARVESRPRPVCVTRVSGHRSRRWHPQHRCSRAPARSCRPTGQGR